MYWKMNIMFYSVLSIRFNNITDWLFAYWNRYMETRKIEIHCMKTISNALHGIIFERNNHISNSNLCSLLKKE